MNGNEILEKISDTASTMAQEAVKNEVLGKVSDAASTITNGVVNNKDQILEKASDVANNIKEEVMNNKDEVLEKANNVVNDIKEDVIGKKDGTVEKASDTTEEITEDTINTNPTTPMTQETTSSPTTGTDTTGSTSSGVANSLGGTSVQMTYDALNDICEKIIEICKTLNEQWAVADSINNSRDQVWTGPAADRYYEDFEHNLSVAKEGEIDTNLSNYAKKIQELIAQNRATDQMISEREILEVNNTMPTISGNSVDPEAHTTDDALNDSVKANDNVNANSADPEAHTTDDALNDSVHANDNVNASVAENIEASTVDTELNDSVGVNGNIGEAAPIETEKTDTTDLEDLVTAYAQASSDN